MSDKHPYFSGPQTPRVMAHRGLVTAEMAQRGVIENSHLAIKTAAELGVHAVESDVHATADGVPVLVHDPDLKRVAGDSRLVREVTLAQMREIMEPLGGVITVAEALAEFPNTRFQLDVKAQDAAVPLGKVIAPHGDRILLTSFSEKRRKTALSSSLAQPNAQRSAQAPGKAALFSIWGMLRVMPPHAAALQRKLRQFSALQIPISYLGLRVLSKKLLRAAQLAGVEVHIWTINDLEQMRQLVEFGVDGIITDRADAALELFHPEVN